MKRELPPRKEVDVLSHERRANRRALDLERQETLLAVSKAREDLYKYVQGRQCFH
jgi:hypothetical protein